MMNLADDRVYLDSLKISCGMRPALGDRFYERCFGALSYEHLTRTQWSDEFERLMRNRLICGGLRYGLMRRQGNTYDNIGSIVRRAALYRQTGNQELLVDIANIALVEFTTPSHPAPRFDASDDGEHLLENAQ